MLQPQLFDTHLHAVSPDIGRFPRRDAGLANGRWWETDAPVDADHVVGGMASGGVDRGLLVQAFGVYGTDNHYLLDALRRWPEHLSGSTIVDASLRGAQDLRASAGGPANSVAATRLFHIPTPDPPWLDGPIGDALVDAAADAGLIVQVCVFAHDLPRLVRQLVRRPDAHFALDHCGFVAFTGSDLDGAADLWALTEHANLSVKLTPTVLTYQPALTYQPGDDAPFGRSVLEELVRRFGAERVMWGSDYPQHRTQSYADQVAEIASWTEGLSTRDRDYVLSGTARRLFDRTDI